MKAVDLFSGCGGLTEGLKKAGFQVVAAVELDCRAAAVYRENHPEVNLIQGDIRSVDPRGLLRQVGLSRGQVDLLAGCPPCQGFSRLRTRNSPRSAADRRNSLVGQFSRFVEAMRPRTIMLENVPALMGDWRFATLRARLRRLGYSVTASVLNAADYGVPQRRKRFIMLASRVHVPDVAPTMVRRRTVRDAIGRLPKLVQKDDLHGIPECRTAAVRDIIRRIPKNGGSRTDLGRRSQLACHRRTDGFKDVYGRMSWDDVAPTITSGCHNPSKGRFLHPSLNRNITLREAAMLQGFRASYRFNVDIGKEALALMIGNALPPPFIAAQARALKRGINRSSRGRIRKVS